MNRNDELFQLRELFTHAKAAKDSADLNLANAKKKLDEWREILLKLNQSSPECVMRSGFKTMIFPMAR